MPMVLSTKNFFIFGDRNVSTFTQMPVVLRIFFYIWRQNVSAVAQMPTVLGALGLKS